MISRQHTIADSIAGLRLLQTFLFALTLLSSFGCKDRYEEMKLEAEHMHDVLADHEPHQFANVSDNRDVGFRVHWAPIDPARDAYLSRDPPRTTVIHTAISEDLSLPISGSENNQFGVWLVYADFLHAPPPSSWPKEGEFDGGVLSYFTIECRANDDRFEIVSAECKAPKTETGVPWELWLKQGKPQRIEYSDLDERRD